MDKKLFKKIVWYLLIFSVVGLIIETLFCYLTMGFIESRKGLVWGPFCPVYGVGATIIILLLDKYKNNPIKLFVMGSILGNVIEYSLSYMLEAIYGTRFWDYGYLDWNVNGRICIRYSIFWGMLAVILIKFIKKYIDKIIDKIPDNIALHIVIFVFLLIDALATVLAVNTYQNRVVNQYYNEHEDIKKSILQKIGDALFPNSYMERTFPNLRYVDESGKEYFLREMIK